MAEVHVQAFLALVSSERIRSTGTGTCLDLLGEICLAWGN